MEKPIYEKIEYIGERIYNIIVSDDNVVDVYLEQEDVIADYDYIVSFKNTVNVKEEINYLVEQIQRKLKCIEVKILDEQIKDEIDENEEIISIDFYCTIKLKY